MIGIVGGGFGGVSLGIFLKLYGIDAVVVEAGETASPKGGTVTMFPNAMRVLRELGVASEVERNGISVTKQKFKSRGGRHIVDRKLSGSGLYGESAIVICRAVLLKILLSRFSQIGGELRYDFRVDRIEETDSKVLLSSNKRGVEAFSAAIAADGVGSKLRNYVVGERFDGVKYSGGIYFGGYSDWDGDLDCVPGEQVIYVGSDSYFSILPNKEQRLGDFPLFWFTQYRRKERLRKGELDQFANEKLFEEVSVAHRSWNDVVRGVLGNSSSFCKANVFHMEPPHSWHNGKTCLLGDSAHAMNAISGQGAALAMEDAFMLALLIRDHFVDYESVFNVFESLRRRRVEPIAKKAARSNDLLLKSATGLKEGMRNLAYGVITRCIPESIANRDFFYSVEQELENHFENKQ